MQDPKKFHFTVAEKWLVSSVFGLAWSLAGLFYFSLSDIDESKDTSQLIFVCLAMLVVSFILAILSAPAVARNSRQGVLNIYLLFFGVLDFLVAIFFFALAGHFPMISWILVFVPLGLWLYFLGKSIYCFYFKSKMV